MLSFLNIFVTDSIGTKEALQNYEKFVGLIGKEDSTVSSNGFMIDC